MNILACTSSDSSLNSIRPEHEIYVSLARRGHKLVMITEAEGPCHDRLREAGVIIVGQPIRKKLSLRSMRLVRQLVHEHDIDIVYATNSRAIPNCAFACLGLATKLVAYRGTASGLYAHDPSNYLGMLNPRIDGVVCVSKYVTDYVRTRPLLKKRPVVTIYKGHELEWYRQPAGDLAAAGIPAGAFTAICVTNARPHKGLDIVLRASDQLADLADLHLLLVGKGMEASPYRELIANSAMRERIHLAGYRQDAPALIAASDLLLHASTGGEGLPRVILEALACGTAVIASRLPGSREIIDDGSNGRLCDIGDPSSLAAVLRELYGDRDQLQALAAHGSEVITGRMSHARTVEQYERFFMELARR